MTTMTTTKSRGPAKRAGLALGAALLSLLGAVALRARSEEPVRVVDITAKRFQFSPNEVALKRGENRVRRTRTCNGGEAVEIDAFSKPQPHQQHLVGFLRRGQRSCLNPT